VRLALEPLEERSLPSVTTLPPVLAQPLAGHGSGTYSLGKFIPDTGVSYQLSGSGMFGQLGQASISGSVQSVGFILQGHAIGKLTFSNAQGSVSIELQGPVQTGFSPIPQWFTYHVTGATGQYSKLQAHGTLRLQFYAHPVIIPLFVVNPPGEPLVPPIAGTFRIWI
jgi:hypothetical protein